MSAGTPFPCCVSTLAESGRWPAHECTADQAQAAVLLASAVPVVSGASAEQHPTCPCGADVLSHFGQVVISRHLVAAPCLQEQLVGDARETDASGNPILKDSGIWLRDSIKKRFKDADIKYIDPSYLIRSIPTTSNDRIYCKVCCPSAGGGFGAAELMEAPA